MNLRFYILIYVLLVPVYMVAQGLIIPSGAYIVSSNGNLVMAKNWVNNGSFTHTGGNVIFAGGTQTLGGSTATTFLNLSTAAGSTTTITSAGHLVKNVLLSNGTLNANGNLTLLSTASQTAAVDGTGAGEIMGNLVVQRYISSAFGYKYFSSAFQNDSVGDFANDMNLSASFPTFYKHDESLASIGWTNYTNISGVLTPLRGYAANLGAVATARTVDLRGVVNNHTISLNLYNNNMAYTKGFNLVGNPYPSPVNWDASGGWTKTNIDNAVYYFNAGTTDQYTGVYSSYINGVSSDGTAGPTIAALQGFFVHVSNGSYPVAGLLSVNNSARILNGTANFFRVGGQTGSQPLLRLAAGFALETTQSDPVTFYFTDDASANFNKKLDALKLMNTDSIMPNLFALSADVQKLSINAVKTPQDSLATIPLGLITKRNGWIRFYASEIKEVPSNVYVYLSDLKTGISQDLKKDPQYQLFLPTGEYEKRFYLQFSTKELAGGTAGATMTHALAAYSSGGRLFVNGNLAAGEKGNIAVMNMAGQTLYRQEITGNAYQPVQGIFSSGVYIINFTGPSIQQSKKVFIDNR